MEMGDIEKGMIFVQKCTRCHTIKRKANTRNHGLALARRLGWSIIPYTKRLGV